jgi:hypothetical protein
MLFWSCPITVNQQRYFTQRDPLSSQSLFFLHKDSYSGNKPTKPAAKREDRFFFIEYLLHFQNLL